MPPTNLYLDLTREFNEGRTRAVICSGQAVVLHRLAIMSKDGDWILREDAEATGHVLGVLARHGARYRFGAPLDVRWLAGGWSSHLEFPAGPLRVRTDFFTRPPRIAAADLERMRKAQEGRDPPFTDVSTLARMKMTEREKDWAVIGELARLMADPADQLLCSRSAIDLLGLVLAHPGLAASIAERRPALREAGRGRRALQAALDAERAEAMEADERRLQGYAAASRAWAGIWPALEAEVSALGLLEAHRRIVLRAAGVLPFAVTSE